MADVAVDQRVFKSDGLIVGDCGFAVGLSPQHVVGLLRLSSDVSLGLQVLPHGLKIVGIFMAVDDLSSCHDNESLQSLVTRVYSTETIPATICGADDIILCIDFRMKDLQVFNICDLSPRTHQVSLLGSKELKALRCRCDAIISIEVSTIDDTSRSVSTVSLENYRKLFTQSLNLVTSIDSGERRILRRDDYSTSLMSLYCHEEKKATVSKGRGSSKKQTQSRGGQDDTYKRQVDNDNISTSSDIISAQAVFAASHDRGFTSLSSVNASVRSYSVDSRIDVTVPLDVIVYVSEVSGDRNGDPKAFSVADGVSAVGAALDAQLMQAIDILLAEEFSLICSLRLIPAVFALPNWATLVSIFYGVPTSGEEALLGLRRRLHTILLLEERPLLRISNMRCFPSIESTAAADSRRLSNVHRGLEGASGVSDGTLHIVQGNYDYYHYLQDGINDKNWGCSYRSCQTIVSWFKHQGYVEGPIPSHRDIQDVLVLVDGKPDSFAGSRQWVGSLELMTALSTLFDVQCKFLELPRGSIDLAERGRELAAHFDSQGTPAMIGGGVLAHTIAGVDYNHSTGELALLILDPHYIGPDELPLVQNKGGCYWKGPDFFQSNSHYNILLPQRPNMI